MPVKCGIDIEGISTEAFAELDYVVMGHAFDCHNRLGRLADECVYEGNLAARLSAIDWDCLNQVPLVVSHGTFHKTFFLDLVVSRQGVYELKSVAKLTNEHVAQALTYLYLLDLPHGKLINFRTPKVESQFVNAPLSRHTRTSFSINKKQYQGKMHLLEMTVHMLRDLGTALSVSLYQQVLTDLLGGEGCATSMLPMTDGAAHFGNQRFHLATPTEALRVTCFSNIPDDYQHQLRSLLRLSPLAAIEWVNIDVETVTFQTITNS